MKIVCQNCAATYKIADDKVQGKKAFKIKCKKCSADIMVRASDLATSGEMPAGTGASQDGAGEDSEATRALQSPGSSGEAEGVWHAVLNGEQQGPYTVDQLRDLLAQGSLDAETYVWRDGFDNWLPLHGVEELAGILAGSAPAEPSPGAYEPAPIADPQPVSQPAPSGGDLFAAAPVPTTGSNGMFGAAEVKVPRGAPDATARTRAKSAGGDLFAAEARQQEASKPLFSEGNPGAEAPKGDGLTGQRNENSVLFSLATLQQLSGPAAGTAAPAPVGAPSDGGSGLIDINKLAGALDKGANGSRKAAVDDILTVGTGGLGSPLAAPMLAPVPVPLPAPRGAAAPVELHKHQGTNKTVIISVGVVATIFMAGAVGIVALKNEGENNSPQVALNTPPPTTAPPTPLPLPTSSPTQNLVPPGSQGAPGTQPEAAPNAPSGTTPSAGGERPRGGERSAHGSSGTRPSGAGNPSGSAPSAPSGPSGTAPSGTVPSSPAALLRNPTPSTAPSRPSGGGSIEDLLNRIPTGGSTAPTPAPRPTSPTPAAAAPAAGGDRPATPTRESVVSAMRSISSAVRACGNGTAGSVPVTMVFASSGRVTTATAGGQFAGSPIGSCAAQRARSAQLPPFSNSTFTVTYPFTVQ